MKRIFAVLIGLTAVAGCSNVNTDTINPINWFDREEAPVAAPEPVAVIDTRELLPQVTEVSQLPTSNGLILLAMGLPPTQGFWDPVLVPTNNELPRDGLLIYEFRASGPTDTVVEGTADSRELQAARTITANKLEGVTGIRVIALANHLDIAL